MDDRVLGFAGLGLGPLGTPFIPALEDLINNTLIAYFGYRFTRSEEGVFRFNIRTTWGRDYPAYLTAHDIEGIVTYLVGVDFPFQPNAEAFVAELLARLNQRVVLGAICYDHDAHCISYRHAAYVESSSDIEKLMNAAVFPLNLLHVAYDFLDTHHLTAKDVADLTLILAEGVENRGQLSRPAMKHLLRVD